MHDGTFYPNSYSRHHYTKSDWVMWAASSSSADTRRLLVTSLAYWINYTTTEQPFSDLFEVVGLGYYPQVPQDIIFKARPVVGGHFAILTLARSKQLAAGQGMGPSSQGPGSGSQAPAPMTVVALSKTVTGTQSMTTTK